MVQSSARKAPRRTCMSIMPPNMPHKVCRARRTQPPVNLRCSNCLSVWFFGHIFAYMATPTPISSQVEAPKNATSANAKPIKPCTKAVTATKPGSRSHARPGTRGRTHSAPCATKGSLRKKLVVRNYLAIYRPVRRILRKNRTVRPHCAGFSKNPPHCAGFPKGPPHCSAFSKNPPHRAGFPKAPPRHASFPQQLGGHTSARHVPQLRSLPCAGYVLQLRTTP